MLNIILIILIVGVDVILFTHPKTRDLFTEEITEYYLIDDDGKKTKLKEMKND